MQVAVLVILYRGEEYITIHESEGVAWSELVRFVDNRWSAHDGYSEILISMTEEERLDRFFAAETDVYILGKADLSDVGDRLDTIMREGSDPA